AKEALLPYHRILDGALRDNDYLLGDQFTLADINVGSVMMINNLVGSDMAEYPALSAWLNRLMARPCFQ
ncbi:MAG: glutathione S-transferase family protein, partial [Deltaproteobacteria bacterium]|nr:glutathione S-transferase family protein [Deltaproteobacteria bacterium]